MKILIIILFSFIYSIALAQSENKLIFNENLNEKYLEHLIKKGIDSVRLAHHCKPLINDSILYIASKHHSDYMLRKSILTHNEKASKTKTPFKRVKHYQGHFNLVGENVLQTNYKVQIRDKYNRLHNTFTYQQLANSIVFAWVHSPKHFKNMINCDFQTTGISISVDKAQNLLYATQVFGGAPQDFVFTNSLSMFPYSDGKPPQWSTVNSFENIPDKLIDHKHAFKVMHGSRELYQNMDTLFVQQPQMSLMIKRGYFVLKIENSKYVESLIQNRNDGFAVEIVKYDDYMCGNPSYYTKPSRRNGQCQLNGELLKPLYRNQLKSGYRKRRKRKEISYLSYIFGADSVPFFKRFYRYKIAKYSSEYFEIRLARVPKDLNSIWEYNLVTLKDNRICHIDYFVPNCGMIKVNYEKTNFIPTTDSATYHFNPIHKKLHYTIFYERNSSSSEKSQILGFQKELKNIKYTIDSIHINAFSSVDGNPQQNIALQNGRVQDIINILESQQLDSIATTVTTNDSWPHFYEKIKRNSKWRFLTNYDQNKIQQLINQKYIDSLDYILKEERKSEVDLYYTIDVVDSNLQFYIQYEYTHIVDSLNRAAKDDSRNQNYLSKVTSLYLLTYNKVKEGLIDTAFLANLPLPHYYQQSIPLQEYIILFGLEFPKYYAQNYFWKKNNKSIQISLNSLPPDTLSAFYNYNIAHLKTNEYLENNDLKKEDIQLLIKRLEPLQNEYQENQELQENIEKLTVNHSLILLSQVFINDVKKNKDEAIESIQFLFNYYSQHNQMNDTTALQLAKIAEYYQDYSLAYEILIPFSDTDIVKRYLMRMSYHHYSKNTEDNYYNELIELANSMNEDIWCNMFLSRCGISFQAFDHEELRKVFCKKCLMKNKYLKALQGSK